MILFYLKDGRPQLRQGIVWSDVSGIIEAEGLEAGEWALVVQDQIVKPFNVKHCAICLEPLDDGPIVFFGRGVIHRACAEGLI